MTDSPPITPPTEYACGEDSTSSLSENAPDASHEFSSEGASISPSSSQGNSSQTQQSSNPTDLDNTKPLEVESAPSDTAIININSASKEQLMSLNGIGDALSQRIIDTRTQIDGFNSIEELMIVKGIGEKTFADIKHRLTV